MFGRNTHANKFSGIPAGMQCSVGIMTDTFTQIHIHTVFAVQNRTSLLDKRWRDHLYQYIISIIEKHGHKVLSIGGTGDHVHILFGLRPTQTLSSLMQEVKRGTSWWINENNYVIGKFKWQEGYGAFSYSKSQIPAVAKYIENQEIYHAKRSFREEFKKTLDNLGINYKEQYIFHDVEA